MNFQAPTTQAGFHRAEFKVEAQFTMGSNVKNRQELFDQKRAEAMKMLENYVDSQKAEKKIEEEDVYLAKLRINELALKDKGYVQLSEKNIKLGMFRGLNAVWTGLSFGLGYAFTCDRTACIVTTIIQVILMGAFYWNASRKPEPKLVNRPDPPMPQFMFNFDDSDETRDYIPWKYEDGYDEVKVPMFPLSEKTHNFRGKMISEVELIKKFQQHQNLLKQAGRYDGDIHPWREFDPRTGQRTPVASLEAWKNQRFYDSFNRLDQYCNQYMMEIQNWLKRVERQRNKDIAKNKKETERVKQIEKNKVTAHHVLLGLMFVSMFLNSIAKASCGAFSFCPTMVVFNVYISIRWYTVKDQGTAKETYEKKTEVIIRGDEVAKRTQQRFIGEDDSDEEKEGD